MTETRPGAFVALATATALLAAAPAAHGATAEPLKDCFLSVAPGKTEPVPVTSAGFGPNAAVEVRIDGERHAVVNADADGRITGALPAPHQERGERTFTIELVERDAPANLVRLESRVTALSVSVKPRAARPTRRVRWSGRGFVGDGPVYAHYVRAGRERETIRLARPRGACGRFSVRRRQFPFRPSIGAWTVQIDQQPRFSSPPNSPFVQLPIAVRRVQR